MNVSKFTVQSWEQGKSEPSHKLLVDLCHLYHVTSDFLLGLTDDDPIFIRLHQERLNDSNRLLLSEFASFLKKQQQNISRRK